MAKFDLSTQGDHEKVTRIVRPFNNIGPAVGGDEVTIDAAELRHPAVNDALWTRTEMKKAEDEAEEQRRARMRTADTSAQAVNDQLKQAVEERKRRKSKESAEALAKAKAEARGAEG